MTSAGVETLTPKSISGHDFYYDDGIAPAPSAAALGNVGARLRFCVSAPNTKEATLLKIAMHPLDSI